MSIPVNNVFDKVAELSRKGQSGSFSGADFNRMQRVVQDTLISYYFSRFEETQAIPDAMYPFIKLVDLTPTSGVIAYPGDYRDHVELSVRLVDNQAGTTEPKVSHKLARYYKSNSVAASLESSVRAPSLEKRRFYFQILNDGIHFYPKEYAGAVKVKYFMHPPDATYATIFDDTNNVENFNSGASINFQWNSQDEINLIDLFLFFKGIQTRQSELIQWVQERQSFTQKLAH